VRLSRKLLAEFIGTAFLLAAVVGSGIMGVNLSAGNAGVALLANAAATAGMLYVLIVLFGPISGAHFNPAVTLALRLRGELGNLEAAAYVLVQLVAAIAGVLAERGETVAFVGGSPDVAERAAARWRALPGLKVVVAGAGVAVDEDGIARSMAREDETVEVVRSTAPTIVLVGLGAPKQERWIERHADAFPSVRIMIGVGGAFDIWAGSKRRAPRAFRTLGLEWLWRLALEPRRLPRTLRATVVFPVLAMFDRAG